MSDLKNGRVSRANDSTVTIRATGSGPSFLALLEAAARIDGASIHCGRAEPEPEWDAAKARDAYDRDGHALRVLAEETGLSVGQIDSILNYGWTPTGDEAWRLNRALGLGGAS